MFTRTLDTAVGPVVVEVHPAGWCVAPTHVNLAERMSFAQQRSLCLDADEIHNHPLDVPAAPTLDLPALDDVKAVDVGKHLVGV